MAKPVASYLPPAGPLNATLITWECGREMHRVHDDAYLGDQFNPNSMGNARFSPIHDTDGVVIPSINLLFDARPRPLWMTLAPPPTR
jgi:hypothetical protein